MEGDAAENVQVVVRVRPLNKGERERAERKVVGASRVACGAARPRASRLRRAAPPPVRAPPPPPRALPPAECIPARGEVVVPPPPSSIKGTAQRRFTYDRALRRLAGRERKGERNAHFPARRRVDRYRERCRPM